MSEARQSALRLIDLSFAWPGAVPLLRIGQFELRSGERVFLAGPSGSGKSTLLGLLAGTLTPQRGDVHVADLCVSRLSARARDRARADHIGVIFQQFNLLPFLSVLDNVTLACRFSRRRTERAIARDGDVDSSARRLLAELGLPEASWVRPASSLSVGQQQRVAAARALIGAPELILADEPTSALDADARGDFLRLLLDECAAANTALLFVSHDRSLMDRFDRAVDLRELQAEVVA